MEYIRNISARKSLCKRAAEIELGRPRDQCSRSGSVPPSRGPDVEYLTHSSSRCESLAKLCPSYSGTEHLVSFVVDVDVGFDNGLLDEGAELIAQLIVDVVIFVPGAQRQDEFRIHFGYLVLLQYGDDLFF